MMIGVSSLLLGDPLVRAPALPRRGSSLPGAPGPPPDVTSAKGRVRAGAVRSALPVGVVLR